MLLPLVVVALTVMTDPLPAPSPDPAPSPAPEPEARREAADVLRFSLAAVDDRHADDSALPRLVAGGEAAAATLAEGTLAADLRAAVEQARAHLDPRAAEDADAQARDAADTAESALRETLERALGDLDFEPVVQAALPEGFPAPTPVGEIEVKRYPRYRIARADSGSDAAFWQLFMHIKKHDIPMTAPVEMTYDAAGDEIDMAFMYEHAAQGRTGPDETVEVLDVEPMLVVSIGCRGWSTDRAVDAARERLLAWIDARADLEPAGSVRRFGYNGPSVPGSRRYYEVQVPVRAVGEVAAAAQRGGD